MTYSVHDEPDFARVYDEDEMVSVRRGDVRAMLDALDLNLNMASNALDEEETEAVRALATAIGMDPLKVTPQHLICKYQNNGEHVWEPKEEQYSGKKYWRCSICNMPTWDKA